MKFADARPVFVPMMRRKVTRCRWCKVPGPDHLLICRLSAGLLSREPEGAPDA